MTQLWATSVGVDTAPASGWYPDPTALRYWDGQRWTDRTRFAGPPLAGTRVVELATLRGAGDPSEGMTARPVLTSVPPAPIEEEPVDADREGAFREFGMFLLVAVLALFVAAAVAGVGIALTT